MTTIAIIAMIAPESSLMAWIAFASVPAMLVVMLAMGQLEARLLPRNPPGDQPRHGYGDRSPADAGPHWKIPAPAVESGPDVKGRGTMNENREEAGT